MDLSIVIPIKDEKDNIKRLHERISAALDGKLQIADCRLQIEKSDNLQPAICNLQSYEIVLVDDGSTDGSHLELQALAAIDARVKVVRLRRNFGQSAAMQAGIDFADGDVIVTMDGDLQNDPADIPMLVDTLRQGGYDAVFGLRAHRQDTFVNRTLPSTLGNWLIRTVTGVAIKDMGCTLRAIKKDLAKSLSLYGEMHRFIPVLVQHAGATFTQVPVQHHPRTAGQTKYNITRTFRVMLDLITVKFMQTYMTRPMHVMGLAGMFAMFLGAICLLATVGIKWMDGTSMIRNPLLHLSVMLELVGVQFISTGLLGELMTRTYFESQGKRAYAVRSTLNVGPMQAEERRAA
ncbi:MAG: glycosyltransferase family 2 protein [Planctomycetes bacterium]|nr:glycosyltransferase family 2 protein [Planctomycetota bacterium]